MYIEAERGMIPARKFAFDLHMSVTLSVNEIWPDGDAPENPTAEDVKNLIEETHCSIGSFLSDWNLDREIEFSIRPRDDIRP